MGLLTAIDVCAGSGIGSAAFEALGLARTVCYVEWDGYCQRLLQQRIRDGWLADAPIWDDLKAFDGRPWAGRVDFIFGGIPCQPWSVAGKQRGAADERDLWPDFYRVVREVGPRFVLLENVPGMLANGGLRRVLGGLALLGFDAEWGLLSAATVGAPHVRKRLWILAKSFGIGCKTQPHEVGLRLRPGNVAGSSRYVGASCRSGFWDTTRPVGARPLGVDDGLAGGLEPIKVAGNGWVPQVAAVVAGRIAQLAGIELGLDSEPPAGVE